MIQDRLKDVKRCCSDANYMADVCLFISPWRLFLVHPKTPTMATGGFSDSVDRMPEDREGGRCGDHRHGLRHGPCWLSPLGALGRRAVRHCWALLEAVGKVDFNDQKDGC